MRQVALVMSSLKRERREKADSPILCGEAERESPW
jgi:hypothetical protein